MADAYDFQIETLKFRVAARDELPYTRGTAPFRKEQFDSAPTVGDQSLSGWWTRGQLSFHKGEGLKYYEVLESETVLNRYWTSDKCNTFKTPGEAVLDRALIDIATTTAVIQAACTFDVYNQVAYLTDSGQVWYTGLSGGGATQVTLNGTTPVAKWIAGDDDYLYVAVTDGANYKIQRYSDTTHAYVDTIYTDTVAINRIWIAKDRLWVFDSAGKIYAVAKVPGVIPTALANPVCTIGTTTGKATLTDGGAAVFVGQMSTVYAITIASDGSLPTLSAPVSVLALPVGETIQCIRAYLGYMCLVTSKGVRFAAIYGTELSVGPLMIEWHTSDCRTIGTAGNKVYVTGTHLNSAGTTTDFPTGYEIDLSGAVGDNPLVFPYRKMWLGAGSTSEPCAGALEHGAAGDVIFYGDDRIQTTYNATITYTLAATATLRTAYHRLGTLDLKHFNKVVVRASGTGTIQTYRVDADGTETSLGTMNAVDGKVTYTMSIAPAERIALKFVLSRDGADATKGPTLLGYQLKALPVPERQHILKVPLVIQDKIRLRRGPEVGNRGRAYTDITALEALETSKAVVTFTDHRTGETGSAYIDSVEFQGDTPSTATSNGFGGVAYVTLRVLS